MRRMISVIFFLLLATSVFCSIFYYAENREEEKYQKIAHIETIRIYTDFPADLMKVLTTTFTSDTSIHADVTVLSSQQLLERVLSEEVPPDLIMASQDTLRRLQKKKALKPFVSQSTDTVLNPFKDPEGYWTGIWMDPVVFAVNGDFADKHKDFKYTWDQILMDPRIQLSMTDIISSDMASDILLSMVEHFGIKGAMDRLRMGGTHIVQYGKYLSTPSRLAAMGKCDIAISSMNEAVRAQKENLPLKIFYPIDGTAYYLYGLGMGAKSSHPELAAYFINWVLSAQHYKEKVEKNGYYYMFMNDAVFSADSAGQPLYLWELEKRYSEEGKKELVDQWIHEIRFRKEPF